MDLETLMIERGEDLQFAFFFAFLVLFLGVERLVPRRPRPAGAKRLRTNAALTVLSVLSLPLVPVGLLGASHWAEVNGVGLFQQVALPVAFVIPATLLLRGLLSTGTHWLNHRVPLLWRIHRVHHLDTDLDVSSTVRFHPLEFFVGALVGVPFIVVLGLPFWVLALYELLDVTVTLFSHSNTHVPGWIDRWLRYLIVTPDLHRVHHSTDARETDSNYGAVFPIWDMVLGTYVAQPRASHEEMPLGLEVRDDAAHDLMPLLAMPFRRASSPPSPEAARVAH